MKKEKKNEEKEGYSFGGSFKFALKDFKYKDKSFCGEKEDDLEEIATFKIEELPNENINHPSKYPIYCVFVNQTFSGSREGWREYDREYLVDTPGLIRLLLNEDVSSRKGDIKVGFDYIFSGGGEFASVIHEVIKYRRKFNYMLRELNKSSNKTHAIYEKIKNSDGE